MFDGHYKEEVSVTRICFAPRRRKPNAAGVGAIPELFYDAAGPRPSRHVASFAASIAAHAAIVGLIVCFASPMASAPGEFVLAYLVEGTDGAAGHGGARDGAFGASSIHAHGGPLATPESVSVDQRKQQKKLADAAPRSALPRAAKKPRRRIEEADSEVASLAPMRSVAPARSADSEHDEQSQSRDGSPGGASDSFSAAVSGIGAGSGGATAAGGIDGAGNGAGVGDPNSIAHADYARNPPPAYPAIARRRAQQGTVTVSVLVGADGSVERAEVADSSGFDALDDAALETVRSRWRFVPARYGGLAVESWVLVPIRFALIEANAAR
jgi:TonB family protein